MPALTRQHGWLRRRLPWLTVIRWNRDRASGESARPSDADLERFAEAGVYSFLAAYGVT